MKKNKVQLKKAEVSAVVKPIENPVLGSFLSFKLPLWLVVVIVAGISGSFLFFKDKPQKAKVALLNDSPVADAKGHDVQVVQQRLNGYKFTNPLLGVDIVSESDNFTKIKSEVSTIINRNVSERKMNSASVFMKKCSSGEWFSINPGETFYTASLMKVAVMITILKMSESNPGFLNQVHPFRFADPRISKQTFTEKTITTGNDYTIRDLLYYMIVYSDNYASNILNNKMDVNVNIRLFNDIGIAGYNPEDQFRKLTAMQIGKLFGLLYDASYLSKENSEYALSLLAQSKFDMGLTKKFPAKVLTAHKFAEAGDNNESQLHDAGIVYDGNTPYMLVVMTRGNDLNSLSDSIGEISKYIYDHLNPKVQ